MATHDVERHSLEISNWPEILAMQREQMALLRRRDVPKQSHHFNGFADVGQMLLALFSILERNAPDMFDAARMYAHGQTGFLAMGGTTRGETIELPCQDRRTVVEATGPTSSTHAVAWVHGWYAALMTRDAECLDLLSAVPDSVLRSSATNTDAYHFAWKAALVAFRQDAEAALSHANDAIRLTLPDNLRIAGSEIAKVEAATFRILPALARKDADGFQEALVKALIARREFYTKNDPHGRAHEGFVAWGPLALARLAHDRGMPIDVDSEYLLPPLIDRQPAADAR